MRRRGAEGAHDLPCDVPVARASRGVIARRRTASQDRDRRCAHRARAQPSSRWTTPLSRSLRSPHEAWLGDVDPRAEQRVGCTRESMSVDV
eukprot:2018555-Prymnesium_polylepis.2